MFLPKVKDMLRKKNVLFKRHNPQLERAQKVPSQINKNHSYTYHRKILEPCRKEKSYGSFLMKSSI